MKTEQVVVAEEEVEEEEKRKRRLEAEVAAEAAKVVAGQEGSSGFFGISGFYRKTYQPGGPRGKRRLGGDAGQGEPRRVQHPGDPSVRRPLSPGEDLGKGTDRWVHRLLLLLPALSAISFIVSTSLGLSSPRSAPTAPTPGMSNCGSARMSN